MSTAERGRVLARMNSHDDLEFRNGIIKPLLTDLYQITMAYAYWKAGKGNEPSVFDLYFRKNPFQGEFTVFAGLEECIKFLQHFYFSDSDIAYLQSVLPSHVHPDFFTYLRNVSTKGVRMYAIDEGHVVFPKVPLIIMEGPLAVLQLMETSMLNLVNYASLVATNATRFRQAAGNNITLLEFGLRRAQGPDGGLSASRYCYLGGFDGTSNVLAGKLFGIPVKGTHAHAFVTSFQDISDISNRMLKSKEGSLEVDFVALCLQWQEKLSPVIGFPVDQVNKGELAAFISYAQAFPHGFLALVDSYDVLKTGIPNFCTVAMALNELGYRALGVRIDSGDLAYLSNVIRKTFCSIANRYNLPWVEKLTVVASNDINEDTIHSLKQQIAEANLKEKGHSIDCFGIGTHLVTCQKQPALGCVYKLVEVGGRPSIKLSEDVEKLTIPGRKRAYRLYGSEGNCLVDLMMQESESPPEIGVRTLCRHPFQESKRAYVIPAKVEALHKLYWDNEKVQQPLPGLETIREKARESLACLRQDHKRALNPTPYKVSVSSSLYDYIHDMWLRNAPIGELY